MVLAEIVPALFQRLYVKPNELELEKPYLEHNIALTRAAYNLHQIAAKPFPPNSLSPSRRSKPIAPRLTISGCGMGSR